MQDNTAKVVSPQSAPVALGDTPPVENNPTSIADVQQDLPINNDSPPILPMANETMSEPISNSNFTSNTLNDTQYGAAPATSDSVLTPNTLDPTSFVSAPQAPVKYGGKKVIAAILGLVLMVGAVGTGVVLVQQQQLRDGSAWDCTKYDFSVSRTGVVTIQNGSQFNEPAQKAEVFINSTLVQTFDVPNLSSGKGSTLGTVSVPSSQGFAWRVHGTVDCEDSGSYQPETTPTPSLSATCNSVMAYDQNWQALSATQLSALKSGDVVRFAVGGTSSGGSFDRARFTINGTQRPEVTTIRPGTSEFYDEYTIPAGSTSFTVSAQIRHTQLGWL
jgi:hypothetical protein